MFSIEGPIPQAGDRRKGCHVTVRLRDKLSGEIQLEKTVADWKQRIAFPPATVLAIMNS
jgi:hypothetical protein